MAQDVQKIIPEIVNVPENEDDYLSIRYTELIPVLTKAIQEQETEIQDQRTAIQDQKGVIQSLKEANQMLLKQMELLTQRMDQVEKK